MISVRAVGLLALRHQRHLAIVVDEADAGQALVRGALGQLQRLEVAQVHRALAELLVELDHQRLVLGTDGADGDPLAVLHRPSGHVHGPGRDGWPSAEARSSATLWLVHHHPRIEREQALGGGQQRVDVDLLDRRVLDDQVAEANHQLFQRRHVHRFASAHALQRFVDAGLLHHAPGQRGVQRRQRQRAVLEDLHQLASGAEQQHRAELRVERRAEDQFVALLLGKGLHRHSLEMARRRPWPPRYRESARRRGARWPHRAG